MAKRPTRHFQTRQRVKTGNIEPKRRKDARHGNMTARQFAGCRAIDGTNGTMIENDRLTRGQFILGIGFAFGNGFQKTIKQDHVKRLRHRQAADFSGIIRRIGQKPIMNINHAKQIIGLFRTKNSLENGTKLAV